MTTKDLVKDSWHLSPEQLEAHLKLADAVLACWGCVDATTQHRVFKAVQTHAKLLGDNPEKALGAVKEHTSCHGSGYHQLAETLPHRFKAAK